MKKQTKELHFKVVIEEDENGMFVASVPALQGCYTQGKSLEEARKRIRRAIELVIESDKEAREEEVASPATNGRFFGIEEVIIHSHA